MRACVCVCLCGDEGAEACEGGGLREMKVRECQGVRRRVCASKIGGECVA